MSYAVLQANLAAAGYSPGPLDGRWGAQTLAALMAFAAQHQATDTVHELARSAIGAMVGKDITMPLRIVHFIAQACHESRGWVDLQERGGQDYFTRLYEGRADLGNTEPGDGARYHGRGIFQLTGRANYVTFGRLLGLNLVDHPDTAAQPDVCVRIAVQYWVSRHLNEKADQDDFAGITKAINGGINGLADRLAILERLKAVWGL